MEIYRCGSNAAHSPHRRMMIGVLVGCSGIAPIWPCGERGEHDGHWVDAFNFHCPGTALPPTDMTGSCYPDSMVPGYGE